MILVTGASSGLGLAICQNLIKKGHHVMGLSRNIDGLNFTAVSCDVSSYDDVNNIAKKLRREGIVLTGLINAAGIASMNLAVTTPKSVVDRVIQTNLIGTIYCCQLFTPLMMRSRTGVIINFSTIAVSLGLKGESIYVASKAGVEGFTRSFAREAADFDIKVNCIAPGPINTNLLKGITDKQIKNITSQQIIPRQFDSESITSLVELLLDNRSHSLSGQTLHVGGV
jgi:3-oxoacyl-[acyl-carrier protein] reductase